MAITIQVRRDTGANWTSANPILAQGEIGENLDNGLIKIGDGINTWSSLDYYGVTASGVIDHGVLLGLTDDDHPQYHTDTRGDTRYYTQDQVDTISGALQADIDATTFIELSDTPSEYINGRHLRTTASGIIFESEYINNLVYIHSDYTGDFSDGSLVHPFKNIYEAMIFVEENYDVDNSVVIFLLPGVYDLSSSTEVINPAIKAIVGSVENSVTIQPTVDVLGAPFIVITQHIVFKDINIDATYNSAFATTSGSIGIKIINSADDTTNIYGCEINGFYNAINCVSGSNTWLKAVDINDTTIGLDVSSGSILDADILYIDGAREKHIYAHDEAEVYIGESEFSSAYIDGLTMSGTAIYAEGEDTYVELFAGTNIWSCDKNIVVKDGAEVKIDNAVLEETNSTPGIEQINESHLTIINSRAPLAADDINIENPEYCYINAFDSSNQFTTMGAGAQSDQTIFSINTGVVTAPVFRYEYAHDGDNRAVSFFNPTAGEKTALCTASTNAEAHIGVHPEGNSAHSFDANLVLVSTQEGDDKGWILHKGTGTTPQFTLKTVSGTLAVSADYNGDIGLNTGTKVNKILDEDTFASNDAKALITQQSAKAYVDNTTYSTTALNSGQLDNRYYTETEINTWRAAHPFTASGISYSNTAWDVTEVKGASDKILDYTENVMGTGRISPEITISGSGTSTLYVNAGEGFINYDNFHRHITWDYSEIDVIAYPFGIYYVYVDGAATIHTSTSIPNKNQNILLGYFYTNLGEISAVIVNKFLIDNYYNRVNTFIDNLGLFLTTDSGALSVQTGDYQKVVSSACAVQAGTTEKYLTEVGSADAGIRMWYIFLVADVVWLANFYFSNPNGYNGRIPTDIWNDTTASGYIPAAESCTFTQNSNIVTAASPPSDIVSGDIIWLNEDSYVAMVPVATVSGTTITLESNYIGAGGSGLTFISKALPKIPNGKWTKQIVYRDLEDELYVIAPQSYYDTEEEAIDSPASIVHFLTDKNWVKIAYIVCSGTQTDLSDSIYDIRPLPFYAQAGGGSSGGAAVTDHGVLTGLGDDDHVQYSLINGSRSFTSKVSYNSHPTFSSDTELIDKKYVDDVAASFNLDHGNLTGLNDDDHPQYHNDARGDARYYTQDQIDTISGSIITEFSSFVTLATVQVHRTTDLALTTSYQDITFDVLDVETQIDVIERDDTNTERILIKEDGTYRMDYIFSARSTGATRYVYSRLTTNGTTEIPGSYSLQDLYADETHQQVGTCIAELTTGDYVTVQARAATTPVNSIAGHNFRITKLNGLKGDAGVNGVDGVDGQDGAPGSGSTLIVKDEGVNVTNTPHSAFNFTGTGVTVTDAGSGVATINVPGAAGSTIVIQDEGSTVTGGPHSTLNFTGQMVTAVDAGSGVATIDIPYPTFGTWYAWGGDATETSTNSTSPVNKASLTVNGVAAGYYRIGWFYEWRKNTVSVDYRAQIRVDTTTVMEQSEESKDVNSWHTEAGFYIAQFTTGNHTIYFDHWSESSSYTSYTRRLRIEIWRVA